MTLTASPARWRWVTQPSVSGFVGVLVWVVALVVSHPRIVEPGEPGVTWGSWSLLLSFALIGLAMAYGLGRWGWSGSPVRLAATAEVLASPPYSWFGHRGWGGRMSSRRRRWGAHSLFAAGGRRLIVRISIYWPIR